MDNFYNGSCWTVTFRRVLSQVLAGTANNMLLLGLGAATSFPTIELGVLTSDQNIFPVSENELSWAGSLVFLGQPLGSLISGTITDAFGRKKALIIANVPHIIAWILLWRTQDLTTLLAANCLLGIGTGLMEVPSISYLGEICEPSVRGVLISTAQLFSTIGVFGVYCLGTFLPWRTAAAVCLSIPIATILVSFMVPESPIWLLSKGRDKEALQSLAWLRGWVDPSAVRKEFTELIDYNEYQKNTAAESMPINIRKVENRKINKWKRFKANLKSFKKNETLIPFTISFFFFFFSASTSLSAVKPNLVNIFKVFNVAYGADWAMVGVGIVSIVGAITCMLLIKVTGKRPLVLSCMAFTSTSTVLLAVYAYCFIPHDISSYTETFSSAKVSYSPLVLFMVLVLCGSMGIEPISWTILSEILPYKSRANCCGILAALSYTMNFIITKTYINVEGSLHIYGAFFLYGVISFIGLIYLFFALPETENRRNEDIQADFANGNGSIINEIKRAICRRKMYHR